MPDVQIDINGKDNASPAIKSVTGSIIKGQIAVELIKQATKALINVTKESIEAFRVQEQAEAKLQAATGQNISEFKKFASSMQAVTTIGDEAILQAQTLASAMGVQNNEINKTTQGAIGLSKAFGMDLSGAMKLSVQATEGNYTALARYIPALKTATSDGEKQAIVQEAMAKGFKIATAEANTFSGKMDQLKNIQGDIKEEIGRTVSVLGKDFVEAQIKAAKAISDFLTTAENVANIGATFSVIGDIFKEIGTVIKDEFVKAINDLKSSFSNLTGEAGGSNAALSLLSGTIEALKIGISIIIQIVSLAIKNFVNMIIVVRESAQVIGDLFAVLKRDKSFADVKKSMEEAGAAVKNLGADYSQGIEQIVTSTVEKFKKLPQNTKTTMESMKNTFKQKHDEIIKEVENQQQVLIETEKVGGEERVKLTKEELLAKMDSAMQWTSTFVSATMDAFNAVGELGMQFNANEQQRLQENLDKKLSAIDKETQAKLTALGLQDLTQSQQKQKELADLKKKFATEIDVTKKADLAQQIAMKEDEITKAKIIEDGNDRKNKAQKKAAQKEYKLKVDAFNAQKALDLVTAGVSMALGSAMAVTSAMSLPFPGSVIAAAILGTLVTAAGIASMATIASKQAPSPPAFASGVTGFGGGMALVGERGPEMVTLGRGSNVITNENTEKLLGSGLSGFSNYGTINVMANDPVSFVNQLTELSRFEGAR